MALKIRLRQQGRTNRAFYRLVVTNERAPRDGAYIEALGWYNPIESEQEKMLSIKQDRIQYWLDQGAQMSEKTASLIGHAVPTIIKAQTQKVVAKKAKRLAKRKAQKAA